MARRRDCDDVLYQLLDDTGRVAVVHLTYAVNADMNRPQAELFDDLQAWCTAVAFEHQSGR